MAESTCSLPDCEGPRHRRGWCSRHYKLIRAAGLLPPPPTLAERFWAKVDLHGPIAGHRPELGRCWIWKANRVRGYGGFQVGRRDVYAHRFAYTKLIGQVPDGLDLDHLCRVRHCVRPSHLEPVTRGENLRRGVGFNAVNAAKTHCLNGHPFDDSNTYWRPDGGGRQCLKCKRAAERRWAENRSREREARS